MARNNTVRTDVISKLGILERQEAAWKDSDYNYVWEGAWTSGSVVMLRLKLSVRVNCCRLRKGAHHFKSCLGRLEGKLVNRYCCGLRTRTCEQVREGKFVRT